LNNLQYRIIPVKSQVPYAPLYPLVTPALPSSDLQTIQWLPPGAHCPNLYTNYYTLHSHTTFYYTCKT